MLPIVLAFNGVHSFDQNCRAGKGNKENSLAKRSSLGS
jgi:hypothetical protein